MRKARRVLLPFLDLALAVVRTLYSYGVDARHLQRLRALTPSMIHDAFRRPPAPTGHRARARVRASVDLTGTTYHETLHPRTVKENPPRNATHRGSMGDGEYDDLRGDLAAAQQRRGQSDEQVQTPDEEG